MVYVVQDRHIISFLIYENSCILLVWDNAKLKNIDTKNTVA